MTAEEVLEVATGALRADATAWRAQITHANEIQQKLAGLHFGIFESVTFGVVMAAYQEIWTFTRDRMQEAATQFEAAGRTLESIADKYERIEAERQRQMRQYEQELLRLRQGR
jgi:hypothetical protein